MLKQDEVIPFRLRQARQHLSVHGVRTECKFDATGGFTYPSADYVRLFSAHELVQENFSSAPEAELIEAAVV
jgi:hypothetical protein